MGALIARLSDAEAVSSGNEKLLELVRRAIGARALSVVPFGPEMRMMYSPLCGQLHPSWLMMRK